MADAFSIAVPDNSDARRLFDQYTTGIKRIQQQPNAASNSPCIVCDGNHRFYGCDVLRDNAFLGTMYVDATYACNDYCSYRINTPKPDFTSFINIRVYIISGEDGTLAQSR